MAEYHCEFCKSTGTRLRNEEKGCCNNCGAPIGITKDEAQKIYDVYYRDLSFLGTSTILFPRKAIPEPPKNKKVQRWIELYYQPQEGFE